MAGSEAWPTCLDGTWGPHLPLVSFPLPLAVGRGNHRLTTQPCSFKWSSKLGVGGRLPVVSHISPFSTPLPSSALYPHQGEACPTVAGSLVLASSDTHWCPPLGCTW